MELEGSLSEKEVYEARRRICDIGFLRHLYHQQNGRLGYRCPAEPVDHYVKKDGMLAFTKAKICLCNNMFGSVGVPQRRQDGYVEPPIITSGDEFVNIGQFIKPGETGYSASDVIAYLTNGSSLH